MRTRLLIFALTCVGAVAGNAQCLSVPSTAVLGTVTYHLWLPETSYGLPCGNGSLVIYAHGYVTPGLSPDAWLDELSIGGVSLPATLNQAGYAFAASDYRKTGLAILEGMQDTLNLANAARTGAIPHLSSPLHTFLIGASEGGLVTTLSAERLKGNYNSAAAACGPIGSFQSQLDYFGDFRVLFDYFFPNVIPGNPVSRGHAGGRRAVADSVHRRDSHCSREYFQNTAALSRHGHPHPQRSDRRARHRSRSACL